MKKILLYTMLAACLFALAGCKSKNIVLTPDNVKSNTVLIKNDGTVQSATVESFDKEYYNLDELKQFITGQINTYTQENGKDSIVIEEDTPSVKDGNAVLVLNYASLEHYAKFNNVKASQTSVSSAQNGELKLPDVYVSAKDGAFVQKEVALKNPKYMVLVLNEKTEVALNGTIKYFTNGTLNGKHRLTTGSEEESVIIYKP